MILSLLIYRNVPGLGQNRHYMASLGLLLAQFWYVMGCMIHILSALGKYWLVVYMIPKNKPI